VTVVVAPVLAPDRAVPARDLLLDADEMAARLSRLLAVDGPLAIDRYERGRVKYKVGDSLRVVHELHVDGEPQLVASRTFADGRSAAVYERARTSAHASCASLPGVAHDPDLQTVFWTFPNDRKLATLGALAPAAVARLLRRPVARTVLAAYAPEKSATVACLDGGSGRAVAYAKVYASAAEAAAGHRAHAELFARLGTRHPGLRLPAVLAYSPPDRMLIVEALAGARIDTLDGAPLVDAMRAFGAALATLHALPVPLGLRRFVRLAPRAQGRAAELIALARPDVAVTAARLAGELAGRPPAPDGPPVCLHGDLHLKNGLSQDGRVALIDLDQAGSGPAAADLGSAIAGLRYEAILDGDAARAETLEHALLDGYGSQRALPDGAALRWHLAAALLSERALRAVNRIRPDGLAHLASVLAEARTVLRAGAAR
jgi:tRNA A-37 threonylcarbamoyl transferase component Bud32